MNNYILVLRGITAVSMRRAIAEIEEFSKWPVIIFLLYGYFKKYLVAIVVMRKMSGYHYLSFSKIGLSFEKNKSDI